MQSATVSGALRGSAGLRAWPVVVFSVGLGSVFHSTAGGMTPSWTAHIVMLGLLWVPARILLARRPPLALVATSVAVGQMLVHLFLTITAGHDHDGQAHASTHASMAPTVPSVAAPGTLADALGVGAMPAAAMGPDPVDIALGRLAEEMTAGHLLMGLAHAGAGLIVGLWLARGERAVRALVAVFRATLGAPQDSFDPVAASNAGCSRSLPSPRAFEEPPILEHVHQQAARVLRGPPMHHASTPRPSFALAA